jgi:hypothetical protein
MLATDVSEKNYGDYQIQLAAQVAFTDSELNSNLLN